MQKYFQIVITHVILVYLFNSFIFLSTIRWTPQLVKNLQATECCYGTRNRSRKVDQKVGRRTSRDEGYSSVTSHFQNMPRTKLFGKNHKLTSRVDVPSSTSASHTWPNERERTFRPRRRYIKIINNNNCNIIIIVIYFHNVTLFINFRRS